jgi:hypothetical protein
VPLCIFLSTASSVPRVRLRLASRDAHRLTRRHLSRRAVMNMIREAREIKEMWRVILMHDQLMVGIRPVIAIGDHRNRPIEGPLHRCRKLELAAIDQRALCAKIVVHQRRALAYHMELRDERS